MIETGRWRAGTAAALTAIGLGLVTGDAALFLASIVGFAYAAYGHATRPPSTDLAVDRTVEPDSPAPGDPVAVRVRVTNETDRPVADVRIADDPPADLPVTAGRPRGAATLQPGESTAVSYEVAARRGEHAFGDVSLAVRNVSGALEARERVAIDDAFDCADTLERLPLQGQTIQHAGRVETDVGGEGVEFHSIRSYHPADPMNRVDWKRLARTGELTTVEFREERAARVVVVVDVRPANEVVRDETELDGVELATHAAGRLVAALLAENNGVGVALYGGRGDYLLPRTGRDQLARARRLLDGDWSESFGRRNWLASGDGDVDRFCKHLADEKQVVFVTPALDDEPVASARRFRAHGHAVTAICPTVADLDTPGGAIERVALDRRLSRLRTNGVRVVEWDPAESLHAAVDRAERRWSG